MKICPLCKSPYVSERVAGWAPMNHAPGSAVELAPIRGRFPAYRCEACHSAIIQVDDAPEPAWWVLPFDVAQAYACELTSWYIGLEAVPYKAEEVVAIWPAVRDRVCTDPTRPYAEAFFYNTETDSWNMVLDTADREWFATMLDRNRAKQPLALKLV